MNHAEKAQKEIAPTMERFAPQKINCLTTKNIISCPPLQFTVRPF